MMRRTASYLKLMTLHRACFKLCCIYNIHTLLAVRSLSSIFMIDVAWYWRMIFLSISFNLTDDDFILLQFYRDLSLTPRLSTVSIERTRFLSHCIAV